MKESPWVVIAFVVLFLWAVAMTASLFEPTPKGVGLQPKAAPAEPGK